MVKELETVDFISQWLKVYCDKAGMDGFTVGVSGGIDSAVTSTLCALTGKTVMLLELPIHQAQSQVSRAQEHIHWLKSKHPNVHSLSIDLTFSFESLKSSLPSFDVNQETRQLAEANTRARLRMSTLYYVAGMNRLLVAGTGNKIEDFGVGFYTKYGDGGVDVSPIADLMKSEVYAVARSLGICDSILSAAPTDGLWGDDRTDEDQLGASYDALEWAMKFTAMADCNESNLSAEQSQTLQLYRRLHAANQHKMQPIPVCVIPDDLRRI